MSEPPSDRVVRAFGGSGRPLRIVGGGGTSWRAGDVVLKPADAASDPTREWLDRVARPSARDADLRIAWPLAALDGCLQVDGWEATAWLAGTRPVGGWQERAGIARRFAQALDRVDPGGLPRREDPWAAADRAAWGEAPGPLDDHPLARVLRPLARPLGVVHGDLAGNTLVHDGLPPAVIDLSLYARPAEWSVAILAVDVIGFEAAPLDLVRTISTDSDFVELVARALLFRMSTDVLLGGEPHAAYGPLVERILGTTG